MQTSDVQEFEAKFRQLVSSLSVLDVKKASSKEKVQLMQNITDNWLKFKDTSIAVTSTLKNSKLFVILSELLEENRKKWEKDFPVWVRQFMWCLWDYAGAVDLFPKEQFESLWKSFRKYIIHGSDDAMRCVANFMGFMVVKKLLLQDVELLNVLQKQISTSNVQYILRNFTTGFDEGQQKLLEDRSFIMDLLAVPENSNVWGTIGNLSQHPDAKTLLPREVLWKASKSTQVNCIDICLLLCSDDSLRNVLLVQTDEWILRTTTALNSMIEKGTAEIGGGVQLGLLDLVLPLANLSVVDSQKENIGSRVVSLLMRLVTDKMPNTAPVAPHLPRGRQEASRALWNFAYLESNRKLIAKNEGIAKLNKTLAETIDPILKRNIAGILYMFNAPTTQIDPSSDDEPPAKGHIMISYNWGSQSIVKQIAKSLQDNGYNVWLDLEQMSGSTLEAMATAVEGSALVLMCMSQKYKDSPNCRLEGEYCMNRRVEFIPLMMQQGYKPDGWLGITLGSKLWYDFSDENNWETKIAALTKVIGDRGKPKGNTRISPPAVVASDPHITPRKPITSWTLEDVRDWMKEEHIDHHFELFKKHKFDGLALSELKRLHSLQNPSFLKYFQQQFGIEEFGEMLRISLAIHKL